MKIAIPIYNNSVSNVFDFAQRLLLVEIEKGKEISRSEVSLQGWSLPQRAGKLKEMGVNLLICGAISRALANMVIGSNIEVIPFVTGPIDQVLEAYFENRLTEPQFLQPGCGLGIRKRFGQRHGGRYGRGRGRGYRRGWEQF